MNNLPLTSLLLFLCTLLLPLPGFAGIVEGIVFTEKGPLPDAVVMAYPDYSSLVSDRQGIVSLPMEKSGQFHFELPPGQYFFIALGRTATADVFSYHGLNPINIGSEYQWLPLFTVKEDAVACEPGPTGIDGQVFYKDIPLNGGVVSAYNAQDVPFRGMGLLTSSLDDSGRFRFDLDAGDYTVIARKRQNGAGIGPVQKGDLFCYHSSNPVRLADSQSCRITLSCYPRDDLEAFLAADANDPRGRRRELRQNASLKDVQTLEAERMPSFLKALPTIVAGKVIDLKGRPAGGLYVTAYPADNFPLFQMHIIRQKTPYMTQTDEDGQYRLIFDKAGLFYLVAREKVGEAPDRFEKYGLYEGNANHSIMIETGDQLTGIDIHVEPIMSDL